MSTITYTHDSKGHRVDVHRPSAINPGDYEYLSVSEARKRDNDGRKLLGPGGICHHCGKAIVWSVHYRYVPTGDTVTFGYICAGILDLTDNRVDHEMNLLKRRVERELKEEKIKQEKQERIDSFAKEYPEVYAYMTEHDWTSETFDFMISMNASLETWGYLTERQAQAVQKIITKRHAKLVERMSEPQPTTDAPEGRQTVRGVIVSEKFKHTMYGLQHKMLVKLDDHNKVWGTMPRSIEEAIENLERETAVGVRVEFSANFTISDTDRHFSFYSKPTKAKVV